MYVCMCHNMALIVNQSYDRVSNESLQVESPDEAEADFCLINKCLFKLRSLVLPETLPETLAQM